VVYDDLSSSSKNSLLHDEPLVVGNICDKEALTKVFEIYDIKEVIHLAALVNAAESVSKSDLYKKVNDEGSRLVYDVALEHGVKIIMYSSSAAVYGVPSTRDPLSESALLSPSNPYGQTKLAAEDSLKLLTQDKAKYGIFRFFNVAGAEEEGRLGQSRESRAIMQRLFAVANGEEAKIMISGHDYDTLDGTVVRDFVHVEDIALAFVLGLTHLRQGKESFILNLGSGEGFTIGQVIKEVVIVTGKDINVEYGARMIGDIDYSLSDITLASQILGWEPSSTLRLMVRDGWNAYHARSK
jgi:UDP-glucose 4-epimerase